MEIGIDSFISSFGVAGPTTSRPPVDVMADFLSRVEFADEVGLACSVSASIIVKISSTPPPPSSSRLQRHARRPFA